jgi:putative lipoic acid-binding regulatory protein
LEKKEEKYLRTIVSKFSVKKRKGRGWRHSSSGEYLSHKLEILNSSL